MNDNVSVISAPLPFSNFQSKREFPAGSSLFDIVNATVPERYTGNVGVIVMLGDHVILDDALPFVRPKQGTIVNIRVVPKGGKGKKNPLAAILGIVVAIAAPVLGAAYGAAVGGALGVSTAIGGAIVSGIVSVVGSLVINAIAPPPKPKAVTSDPSESPTLFIEGARNAFSPYATVPVCLGTNRMFPMQCAKPFTENFSNKQYVTQMFTYGFADRVLTSELKIGDTPIGNFRNIEYYALENGDLDSGSALWSRTVRQENYNVLIRNEDGWVTRSVAPDSDEVVIDTVFPRGLFSLGDDGRRNARNVVVDINFRNVGTLNWLGGGDYRLSGASVFNVPSLDIRYNYNGRSIGQRIDVISLDFNTGQLIYTQGETDLSGRLFSSSDNRNFGFSAALIRALTDRLGGGSSTRIPIARIEVQSEYTYFHTKTETVNVFDARSGENYGRFIRDGSSFSPSKTGDRQVSVSSGFYANDQFNTWSSSAEAVLRSWRIKFPDRGDYEVRIRRVSGDNTNDRIFDAINLSAIKGIRYEKPVNAPGLSGFACRIQATEQLNGAIEQFNAVVSNVIPDYEETIDDWILRPTSNPASIYRYVLQGAANANPISDNKIDIEALERWHTYCNERGYTCNLVVDYNTSVDDILRLVASSGSASPDIVDGKRTVVVDRAGKDVTQLLTPRNSWGYSADVIYPQLPHAFRVTFRNADNGYLTDERIVYRDGYDASNATLFEELQLPHCTNADLAWKNARRFMATATYRPEIHTFYMDFENLVSLRGDRIKFQNDVPLVGLGSARIKEVIYDSSGDVYGLTLDDLITYPSSGIYFIRIRYSDGTQIYRPINASVGGNYDIVFQNPLSVSDAPAIGDLCAVSEAGGELDLIVSKIEPADDLTAKITALNYSPEIFDAELGEVPPFQSVITVPLEFIRPEAPVLVDAQSNESVMQRNIDGSYTSQAVITLENRNEGDINVDVTVRAVGDTDFQPARLIDLNPTKVVIVGLDDGRRYDIHIRYRRVGGLVYSIPLQLNNYLFIGKSTPPADVTGFRVEVVGQTAIFTWVPNEDIDFSHYELRFSSASTGATWETSQVLESRIYENRVTTIAQSGTYLIKAVDTSGNYSVGTANISTFGIEGVLNAVEVLQESPSFNGVKDNTIVIGNNLVLNDVNNNGYYYFERTIDLTEVFSSYLSANLVAGADFKNNVFEIDDMFQTQDVFGAGENDVFAMDNMFDVTDVFGINSDGWEVTIELRTTDEDPSDSGANWSNWEPFLAGNKVFRAVQFRVHLQSFEQNITPIVRVLSVSVDMPDRVERGEDLVVPTTGIEINYSPSFKNNPAVAITLQDGDAGDELVYDRKDENGFELRVFNRVSMTYVARVFDFISSGYGRVEN